MIIQNSEQLSDNALCVPSVCHSCGNTDVERYTAELVPTGCVFSRDNPIQMPTDDLLASQNTYVVENSNDVVIGPVTHFHCPVTIIQKSEVNGRNILKESIEKMGNENNTHAKLKQSENNPNLTTSSNQSDQHSSQNNQPFLLVFNYFKVRQKVVKVILFVSSLLIILAIAIGIIYTRNIITKPPHDANAIGNTTNANPITDTDILEPYDSTSDEPQIIARYVWGGRPPLSVRPLKTPVKYVIVAHTGSGSCATLEICSGIMQSLQSYAVDHASPDIGYNFLVGGDGDIYVGRGWDAINYLDNYCIAVAFIGNFSYDDFTKKMQKALKKILRLGVENSKLIGDYILLSHSQTGATISPGLKIRSVIEKWPHYYPKNYIEIHE